MGIVNKNNETYCSNIEIAQLNFDDNMDKNVALILMDGEVNIDGAVHVCISQQAFTEATQILHKAHEKTEFTIAESPLGMALDNVIQQDYKALIIYGFTIKPLIVAKKDLMPMKDIVDSFCIMYAAARNRISNKKAYEFMMNKNVYILGSMPTIRTKVNDTFGVVTIKRKKENDAPYESIKAFLTEKNAIKYNDGHHPVTYCNLKSLCEFWDQKFGIIIEPHTNYWVEFNIPV